MQRAEVSFEFYLNELCRDRIAVLGADIFERYIGKAQSLLDGLGVRYAEEYDNEIKLCLCDTAEALYISEKRAGIKSESTDGYSVAFASSDEERRRISRAVIHSLAAHGLLYAGVEDA